MSEQMALTTQPGGVSVPGPLALIEDSRKAESTKKQYTRVLKPCPVLEESWPTFQLLQPGRPRPYGWRPSPLPGPVQTQGMRLVLQLLSIEGQDERPQDRASTIAMLAL